ncbi:MAG: helix-turn-helix domain-containing protein [Planctomycetota bacterium]
MIAPDAQADQQCLALVLVLEPLLLTADQAGRLCSVSGRTWQRWSSEGAVPAPVRIGRRRRWRTDELRQWVAAGCPARERWELRAASAKQPAPGIGPGAPETPVCAGHGDRSSPLNPAKSWTGWRPYVQDITT